MKKSKLFFMTAVLILPVIAFTLFSSNGKYLLTNSVEALTLDEDDMDNWYFPNSQLLEYILTADNLYFLCGTDWGGDYQLVFKNSIYIFYLTPTYEYDGIKCCGPGSGECSFSVTYGNLKPDPGKCAKFHQGYQFWDYDFLKDRGRNHVGQPIRM